MPLRRWKRRRSAILRPVAVSVALALASCSKRADPPSGHRIAFATALPLFHGQSSPAELINGPDQRARWVSKLAGANIVTPLARIDAAALQGSILILAQPRALAGEELVAIDDFVRKGGRALVFTDPELFWPSDLPLGDPRRPPVIGLLDPLLDHWGLRLESPPRSGMGTEAPLVIGGMSIQVARAGRWVSQNKACAIAGAGLLAECRIGKGRVLLVADADLLDERFWNDREASSESALFAMISRIAKP